MPRPKNRPDARWTDRRYLGMGGAYLWLYAGVVAITGTINIAIGAIAGLLILDLPRQEYLPIFSRGLIAYVLWMGALFLWAPRLMRPVVRWVRGRRRVEDAPAVWRAATSGPWRLVVVGLVTFAIATLPLVLYVTRAADLPRYGTLLIGAGVELIVAGAAFVDYFAFEALTRPILRDVSRMLPAEFEVPHGAGIAVKILAASVVIPAYGGILMIAATRLVDTPLGLLGLGMAILILLTLTLSLPLSALLARSVVSPVEALVRASREVREGDLGTRVPYTSSDEVGRLSQSFNEMVGGLREREALRSAMGAYVDPVVAQRVIDEGHVLEGVETEVTVMFLDVREFTARSERMSPGEVVAFLNELFGLLVPVIADHGGHVNKFLGDGLLAVFGAPLPLEDHAARGVAAARAILGKVAAWDGGVRIGMGLHSGRVVVGTVGSGARLEYGLIGDTVNVAARIEELTKQTGETILVSESTRRLVRGLRTTSRGAVQLRGRSDPVRVYAVQAGRAPSRTSGPRRGSSPTPRPAGTRSPRG